MTLFFSSFFIGYVIFKLHCKVFNSSTSACQYLCFHGYASLISALFFILYCYQDVRQNPVMIYMKGVPDVPQCGFSALAVRVLKLYSKCSLCVLVCFNESILFGISFFRDMPVCSFPWNINWWSYNPMFEWANIVPVMFVMCVTSILYYNYMLSILQITGWLIANVYHYLASFQSYLLHEFFLYGLWFSSS